LAHANYRLANYTAVFTNPVPGGTPTMRVFFVALIKHTWFNSSAHNQMG